MVCRGASSEIEVLANQSSSQGEILEKELGREQDVRASEVMP
jgi:hypothetical protein